MNLLLKSRKENLQRKLSRFDIKWNNSRIDTTDMDRETYERIREAIGYSNVDLLGIWKTEFITSKFTLKTKKLKIC